ncbi:hypothetical protein [Caproiciproducens sp.]
MYSDDSIVQTIHDMIKPEYLANSRMYLTINKSNYNSINVISDKTPYRDSATGELLFARLKTSGSSTYVSFNKTYKELFIKKGIAVTTIKSDPNFIRINLDIFSPISGYLEALPEIFNQIFIDIFSFPAFGCCSKYVECSDAKRCLHEDIAYATACQYRANLESGRIFYGKNKNI